MEERIAELPGLVVAAKKSKTAVVLAPQLHRKRDPVSFGKGTLLKFPST